MASYYKPHCTSVGCAPRVALNVVQPPGDLKAVLQRRLKDGANYTQRQQSWLTCVKSFSKTTNVEHDQYLAVFTMCLHIETFYKELGMLKYNINGHYIRPIDVNHNGEISINLRFVVGEQEVIRKQGLVKIRRDKDNTYYTAVITDITGPKSFIIRMLDTSFQVEHNQKYHISFVYDNYPIKCCLNALHFMKDYDLLHLLYPIERPTFVKLDDLDLFDENIKRNERQKQAVRHILYKTAYPAPYILFGPPGTGKTATIVEAVYQVWRQKTTNNILVCAPSNTAVDEITIRLLQRIPATAIYRIYAASRLQDHVHSRIQQSASFVDRDAVFLPRQLIQLKRIVVTTLITSTRLQALRLRPNHFSHVFIDEASQATEIETVIPLILSSGRDSGHKGRLQSQIVLSGDPYQLGPIVESRHVKNILGVPMMERLMKFGPYARNKEDKYNASYITKLIRNYRSHASILRIPNDLFYQGELIADEGSHTKIALNWPELPTRGFPIIFHATDSEEVRTSHGSVYNEDEIKLVTYYLTQLIKKSIGSYRVNQRDVAVVTPFKEQRCRIRQELEDRKWREVTVGTVETFQGRERTVIIVSTVRSQSFEHDGVTHLGHLSDPKRFNVAITRAKALLIVIGNPEVLKLDPCWKRFIEYCKERGGYVDCAKNSEREDANLRDYLDRAYDAMRGGGGGNRVTPKGGGEEE